MVDSDDLAIEAEQRGDSVILRPCGEIDLARSPCLRTAIGRTQKSHPARLVVDLRDVPYMDSSGVATLVEAMQVARRYGGSLVLCGMQERVRSIFEIARLDSVFRIVNSLEEAIEA